MLTNIFEKMDALTKCNKEINETMASEELYNVRTKTGRLKYLLAKRSNLEHVIDRYKSDKAI